MLSDPPNKWLKLAGVDVSLSMKGHGMIQMKAGNGSVFDLKDCLWVSELSRNLVSGGLLNSKGVNELCDYNYPMGFALVREDLEISKG